MHIIKELVKHYIMVKHVNFHYFIDISCYKCLEIIKEGLEFTKNIIYCRYCRLVCHLKCSGIEENDEINSYICDNCKTHNVSNN